MKLTIKTTSQSLTKTDLLIVFRREGAALKLPAGVKIPQGVIRAFVGKERETRFTDPVSGPAGRVLLIGLGDGKSIDAEILRRCGAIAVKQAEKDGATSASVWFDLPAGTRAGILGQSLTEGVRMGTYRLSEFKSAAEPGSLKRFTIQGPGPDFTRGVRRGEVIGEANCLARRLKDAPGNRMRPRDMVSEAKEIAASSTRISVEVIDEKAMKRLGMGSLLSVSRGSEEPAYLIHLVFRPKKKKARRKICLVGKGLTFDAGGISLKPSAAMDEMKYDMSGGAAVLGTFHALAALEPDVEVHGLVPTSENLPDGKANKPGDLAKAMNGTTIEILNTDAEGRLILADALAYAAKKIKPDAMIDLATLTGAVVVALGHEISGVMGNDQPLIDALVKSGERCGELVWALPILNFHKKSMEGAIGDLRNISAPGVGAGSSTGGAFLENFVGDLPWAHLDIAGSAWGATDRDYQGGPWGTGVGVRLLIDYLDHLK